MIDMTKTIEPKSDQLNYDDLMAAPMTLKVINVKVVSGDQPVHIEYEGGTGRPFKPCKTMRRVLVAAWGSDGENYIGKSMIVIGDPSVRWANQEVGGIRISHLSDIEKPMRIMLTVTRGKRSPYTIEVLQPFAGNPLPAEDLESWRGKIANTATMAELSNVAAELKKECYDEAGKAAIMKYYQLAVDRLRQVE